MSYALSASRASGAVIRARIAPQKRAPKRAGRAETRIDPGGRVAREGRAEPEASCRAAGSGPRCRWRVRGEARSERARVVGGERRASGGRNICHFLYFLF